ncbi:MAG TPA: hypothetical protein VGH51_10830, partial [Candidatus Angelobacter sp.]
SSKLGVARRSLMAWLSGFSVAIFAIGFSRTIRGQLFHSDSIIARMRGCACIKHLYGPGAIQQKTPLQ